ncbi:hypothetical protein A9Q74_14750 [Colwellia sp. 39_35_sub15_T18]|nr:hypothetical protein A9Q74_14750 [Colwellia sp. 39_35_sub15_T18]
MHNKLLKRKNNSVHRFAIIANHYFPLSKAKPPVKVLNAKGSVTPIMAVRLELAFGKPSADHWLRLQNAHDLWQTRQEQESLHVSPYNFQVA